MTAQDVVVGIDVSKATLDVAVRPSGETWQAANGPGGITGTPPIASLDYRPGNNLGSTVLLDPDQTPGFFAAIAAGTLPPGQVGGVPTS